jgi:hypothetical protein
LHGQKLVVEHSEEQANFLYKMKSSTMAVAGLHKAFLVDLQLANSEL